MIDTGLIENREELLKRLLCYGLFPERILLNYLISTDNVSNNFSASKRKT